MINSTSSRNNCLGGYGYYDEKLAVGKNSKGKWTVVTNENRDKLTDIKWDAPLASEAVYVCDVKGYHGAIANGLEAGALTKKTKSYVEKEDGGHY